MAINSFEIVVKWATVNRACRCHTRINQLLIQWKEVPAAQVSCGPAFTHTELQPTWLSTSSNLGGGHQASMGRGGHQPTMGGPSAKYGGPSVKYQGVISQVWGVVINQLWGGPSAKYGGVSIFPPVCTGSQNPQNYFSNTYVLPSVNRTAGPINSQKALPHVTRLEPSKCTPLWLFTLLVDI